MTAVTSSPENAARERHRSLVEAIWSMPSRAFKFSLEGLFLTIGALCLPMGVVTIILGWYGAAHTGHVYEQNDYLISGGLMGIGLILIGGFLCFGYWMTRQIRATETGNRQTLQALSRLEDKVGAGTSGGAGSSASQTDVLVVTEHGSMVHRPSCPLVADKMVRIVDRAEVHELRPCGVCRPLG